MRHPMITALTVSWAWAQFCFAAPGEEISGRIDAHLAPYDAAGHLSGTLLVAKDGEILYERSYGFANRELGVRNTPNTRFCIASITKPITIALVCRLAEEGKLSSGDSLARWIPDFPRSKDITVSHLLNHEAGIPHRVTEAYEEVVPRTAADMVEFAKQKSLLYEPGEKSIYSSGGFAVLARVTELAGGAPYEDLVANYVFAPAGMTRSAHVNARTILEGRASSYGHGPNGFLNAPLRDLSFLVGAGSVYSTPHDLHLMIRALLEGTLGEAAKIALLRENGVRWNGITNGFRAFADYYSESGIEIIFTGNVHIGAVDRIRETLPRIVAGEAVPSPEVPRPLAATVRPEVLARYEGHYEAGEGQEFDLRAEGGNLYAGDWFLLATSDSTFFSPQDYGRVVVHRRADGRAEQVDWEYAAGVLKWHLVNE